MKPVLTDTRADWFVAHAIGSGGLRTAGALTEGFVAAFGAAAGPDPYRFVDRILQRLRRRGDIKFNRKTREWEIA